MLVVLLASLGGLEGRAAPTAMAQASDDGTFAISPSRRDLVGQPPLTLMPTRVSNTTQETYDVRVFPVLLRQDLTGAFQFDETPPPLNTARMILRASPSRFHLGAGESREVGLGWELLPLGARAAYIGVVFQGQRRLRGGRSVPVISRLLSVNFLRLPGRYHPNGIFSALHATQFAPEVLRILPRVSNTGDTIASPRHGRLVITDSTGHTVYRTSWPGDLVLPSAERDFPIDVRQILPAGSYTAHAAMSFGANRRTEISTAFTLIGPNQLPTPALKIDDFAAHGEVGNQAHVSGHVQSTGTAPAALNLTVSLFRVTGGLASAEPLASRQLHFPALAPRSTRSLDVRLNRRLAGGEYHVVARYTDPTGKPQQLTSDFAATPHRALFERLERFFDGHTSLIILAVTLIAGTLVGFRLLRRQRRLEAELREARRRRGPDAPPSV